MGAKKSSTNKGKVSYFMKQGWNRILIQIAVFM